MARRMPLTAGEEYTADPFGMKPEANCINHAKSAIVGGRRIAVLTGAGISAESGIPTFRDALTGLWARFRPEDLATPEAFLANPKLVWDWYAWRREKVAEVMPNAGHYALAELQQRKPLRKCKRSTMPETLARLSSSWAAALNCAPSPTM